MCSRTCAFLQFYTARSNSQLRILDEKMLDESAMLSMCVVRLESDSRSMTTVAARSHGAPPVWSRQIQPSRPIWKMRAARAALESWHCSDGRLICKARQSSLRMRLQPCLQQHFHQPSGRCCSSWELTARVVSELALQVCGLGWQVAQALGSACAALPLTRPVVAQPAPETERGRPSCVACHSDTPTRSNLSAACTSDATSHNLQVVVHNLCRRGWLCYIRARFHLWTTC